MDLLTKSILEQEIEYKKIEKSFFKNQNFSYVTIRNSIITNCHFENVDLRNCDLLSTKIYSSIFNKVSFDSADIFSIWFSDCQFINTDFTGAGIEDITFVNCTFENCIFGDVSLKNCVFINTKFIKIIPDSCTFSLNNYKECSFKECVFKGSFQYQIFESCQFEKVTMDSNILKYNFGLGQTSGITYIHNSDMVQDIDFLKHELIFECSKNKLFINAVLVDYNFAKEINPVLAIKSIKAIGVMIKNEILLRNDELYFLKNIFHHFYINKLIAPIVLYKLFEELKKIYVEDYSDNIVIAKSKETLHLISNSVYWDFSDFCEQLKLSSIKKIKYIAPAYLSIHYVNEPQVQLSFLLNQCLPGTFYRTSTKNGSFWEYIEVGQNGLEILKIFIQLLGITVPIIYSETKEKHKKEPPKTKIQKDVEINITDSRNQKDTAELIQKTCQLINASDMLTSDQRGYNNNNIKEIKIKYRINIQS